MDKQTKIDVRVLEEAAYIIKTNSTVRETAKSFGVSKSTVHLDVTKRLLILSPITARKVQKILNKNAAEATMRGGLATQQKYLKLKNTI